MQSVAMSKLIVLLLVGALTALPVDETNVLNPGQRTIMKLKQLYLEDKSTDLCEENPVMATECDACGDMAFGERDNCCSDLLQFSVCHYQLIPLLQEWSHLDNQIPSISDQGETSEPMEKRQFARWGLTKGESPVQQWGKPIREGKRYGMASGRRFNFRKFKQGSYAQKP